MFDFLLDETGLYIILTIIGIVVAVIVPTLLYLRQRQKKALSYEILSSTNLFSHVREDIKRDLKISYKDKPIEKLHLIIVRILNEGNMQIESKDYDRPISFSFGKEGQILTAEIVKTYPDSLHPSLKIEERKVELEKTLLNGGDLIVLKMLVDKFNKIEVDWRIAGVKQILEHHEGKGRLWFWLISSIAPMIIAFFALGYYQIHGILVSASVVGSLYLAAMFFFLFGFVIDYLHTKTREKYASMV